VLNLATKCLAERRINSMRTRHTNTAAQGDRRDGIGLHARHATNHTPLPDLQPPQPAALTDTRIAAHEQKSQAGVR